MAKHKGKILVVDDNAGVRSALKILLPLYFDEAEAIASPNKLISRIAVFRPDTVLLDMNFQRDINTGNEGLFWLDEIKRTYSDVQVVLFTAYADVPLAVEGMKRGKRRLSATRTLYTTFVLNDRRLRQIPYKALSVN